jgi:hypothetical protein
MKENPRNATYNNDKDYSSAAHMSSSSSCHVLIESLLHECAIFDMIPIEILILLIHYTENTLI